MKAASHNDNESGMALITTLMVLMLASALMVGFFATIMADQRANGIDRDQSQAYAAAHAGLEKLTSDLATKFETDFNPTAAEINAFATHPPVIPGFQYTAPGGTVGSGYAVTFVTDASGNPAPVSATGSAITAGPYNGFTGLITQYTITSTARSAGGAEVRLRRVLESVAVPVFQFGMFSETDLSFFAGPNFNFGGRVQTNGNLYLAEGLGNTLTLSDRVTTAGEVIRRELSNGFSTRANNNYTGTVSLITAPGVFRNMGLDEGSLVNSTGPPISAYALALNELPINPGWTSISKGTYKSNIMSSRTGGKRLSLPLVSQGANPIDLIVRPAPGEDIARPLIYPQRYFTMASLRILLSDTAADIMGMPTIVAATAPVPLDGTATVAQFAAADATHAPMATARGPLATAITTSAAVALGGTVIPANTAGITANINMPVVNLLVGGNAVNCASRDATNFYGCQVGVGGALPLVGNGSPVTSVPAGAATTLTQSINAGRSTQGRLSVVTTAGFGPTALPFLWVNLPAPAQPLFVTCLAADNNFVGAVSWLVGSPIIQFNQCTGVTAAIPNLTSFSTNSLANAGTPLLNGFIKIEAQSAAGVWSDVTTQILNLGIAAPNQWPVGVGALCADPSPNAVIRLQRLRDSANGNCYYSAAGANSLNATDYWPNVLYDTREGNLRDANAAASDTMALSGGMYYVALDVNNLRRWLAGTIPAAGSVGPNVWNQNGFIVYFSDRRNNRNTGVVVPSVETGEYGFEDVVNPADINGVPDGVLQLGEDINGNGTLETYGQMPVNIPVGSHLPLTAAARFLEYDRRRHSRHGGDAHGQPSDLLPPRAEADSRRHRRRRRRRERPALARPHDRVGEPRVRAGELQRQRSQRDRRSELRVLDPRGRRDAAVEQLARRQLVVLAQRSGGRPGTATSYRMAVAAGKTLSFQKPTWAGVADDFGTDGGAHNFLRYLEGWDGANLNYRGSIVSLYMSRQAVGTYKCCTNVYGPPTRVYTFDTNFLLPSLLPPGTPMFRDVNTLTFRQLLRPNQ